MKATVPRPDGPSERASTSEATKKPPAPTTLDPKIRNELCATEIGSCSESRSGGKPLAVSLPRDVRSVAVRLASGAILSSGDVSPRPFAVTIYLVAGNRTGSTRQESRWDAEPIDVPRYVASLRRGKGLIAAIVVSMTAAVFVISMWLPKTYEASARIVMDDRPGGAEPADAETVRRRLATVRALITTREIRARAAARLEGESVETLEDKVRATVDEDANIVDVHATDNESEGAAAIANTVAREFVAMQRASERQRLARARAALERALARVSSPQSAEADAIRQRLSELRLAEASGGPELVVAEPAQPPPTASSPRPIRNAIFAFFASVFLAVLAALGLGQLAPRVAGARDLGLLTGVPVVADVPRARRADERAGEEAYQELQTALSLRLPTRLEDHRRVRGAFGRRGGRRSRWVSHGRSLRRAARSFSRPTCGGPESTTRSACNASPGLAELLTRARRSVAGRPRGRDAHDRGRRRDARRRHGGGARQECRRRAGQRELLGARPRAGALGLPARRRRGARPPRLGAWSARGAIRGCDARRLRARAPVAGGRSRAG